MNFKEMVWKERFDSLHMRNTSSRVPMSIPSPGCHPTYILALRISGPSMPLLFLQPRNDGFSGLSLVRPLPVVPHEDMIKDNE